MLVPRRTSTGILSLDTDLLRLMIAAILAGALLFLVVSFSNAGPAPSDTDSGAVATEERTVDARWRQLEPAVAGGESRTAGEI